MDDAEKLLENPVMQLLTALSLMLIAERAVTGLIFGLSDLTNLFERLVFDGLWNLPQGKWLAIAIVLGGWIVLASIKTLDPVLLGGAAGAFILMTVLIDNIRGDLPDVLRDLYDLVPPTLFLVGVAVGLLALLKVSGSGRSLSPSMSNAPPPSGFASGASVAPAPAAAPVQAFAPTPTPTPTPTPAPAPAPAGVQEASWLPDPKGEADLRWWDGSAWTDHTHNN